MRADGADFRSARADNEVAALPALPHNDFALLEDFLHFDVVQELEITFFVVLFDGADTAELSGEFGKPSSSASLANVSYMSVHS